MARPPDDPATPDIRFVKGHQIDFSTAVWRRSSLDTSGPDEAAVEVAFVGKLILVRMSPTDGEPESPILVFTQSEWDAFAGGAQDGEFDLD